MAERTHYQPSPRRDDEQHGVYDDEPMLNGGSERGQSVSQGAQESLDDIDKMLAEAEANAGSNDEMDDSGESDGESSDAVAATGLGKQESKPADSDKGSALESPSFRQKAGKFLKSRKGRFGLIGGGTIGLGVGGALMMLSIFSGPFQLIHLSEVLQKNLASSDYTSENRLNKLIRFARAGNSGDIGETRVGKLGSYVFGDTITQLKGVGIEFQRNASTGNPKAMTIDTSKNPELKGLSQDAAMNAISEKFGIPKDSLIKLGTGGGTSVSGFKFAVNTRDIGIKATRGLTKSSLTYLEGGKIITGIRFRVLAKFFNAPSLFHPLEKAQASVENKYATAVERRAAEKERLAEKTKPTVEKAAAARAEMKAKLSGVSKAINGFLLLTAGMCLVRDVADAVVTINTFNIVQPSEIQATDKIAIGEQIKNSEDFTEKQLGGVSEGFVDKDGKSIWNGRALNYLASGEVGGPDLGSDYKQAFSNDTTAAHIKEYLGGGDLGGVACSKLGQVFQGLVSVLVALSGFLDGGASWAVLAAKYGATAVATAGAMYFIEHQATNLLSSKEIVPSLLSGPTGGNLLAYGARAAANTGSRASGGVPLSGTQEAYLNQELQKQDDAQFKSESFFARMFDMHDYRSASSRFADSFTPSFSQNLSILVGKFMNFGSVLPQAFASIIPKAHAAAPTYDWGFPKVAIPLSILNDPATEDPYANGDTVAANILDGSEGESYIEKANTCFGVTIAKADGKWDVTPNSSPADQNSDEYSSAGCDKISDSNWRRLMLFVADTQTMKAAACYQGDDSSCEQDVSSTTATDTSTAPTATGNSQEIAQQILDNPNITYIFSAKDDVELAAQGKPGTNGVPINIKALQIVWALGQKHKLVVSAYESYGQGHSATSAHYTGNAVDIATIDGIGAYKNITSFWSTISPYSTGATFLQGDCAGTHTPPSGMHRLAGDTCNHQHIQF